MTQAQLDIARAELSALQSLKAADCVLSAPEDGTLTQLNLEAGQNSTSVAGLLADRNAASVLTFSLEQASARLATVGTQITVKQGSQSMQTTVTALSDPSEEGSIQITAMLHSGDWKAGSATVEIKLNAGQYEQCLPATAIQTDSSGMFVYLVEERATLLGIQNVLIRLPVTVEAQGDGRLLFPAASADRWSPVRTNRSRKVPGFGWHHEKTVIHDIGVGVDCTRSGGTVYFSGRSSRRMDMSCALKSRSLFCKPTHSARQQNISASISHSGKKIQKQLQRIWNEVLRHNAFLCMAARPSASRRPVCTGAHRGQASGMDVRSVPVWPMHFLEVVK